MRTVLRAAGIGVAAVAVTLFSFEGRAAWVQMNFGPAEGDWGVAANWTSDQDASHHLPGVLPDGWDDDKAVISSKIVHVTTDVRSNSGMQYYTFNGTTIIEIESGGWLGGGPTPEVNGTSQINVRNGGKLSGGSGWGNLNTYAGSTVSGLGNLSVGTSHLNGGTVGITNVWAANVIQDGATVTASAYVLLANGTSYQLKSGSLTTNYLRPAASGALSTFTMTGGALLATSWIGIAAQDNSDTGNGLMEVSGGTVTSNGAVGVGTNTVGTGRLKISGSNATFSAASLTIGSHGTLEYAFGPAGVTKIGLTGGTTLGGALSVDVTGYAEIGTLDLMSYAGTRTGTFGTVTVLSNDVVAPWTNLLPWGTPVGNPLLMPQGYYYLDYGAASNSKISLLFNVPEPATLSLLALGGLALLKRRSRRA